MSRRQFGRIRQLASGRWQARCPGADGSLHSLGTFRTKSEAAQALAAYETDVTRGAWVPLGNREVIFREYAEQWLAARPLRPRTQETYADHLRLRLYPAFGSLPLSKITPQVVRGWHAQARTEVQRAGKGTAVLSHSYRVLRAILTTAVDDELIPRNPCMIRGAGTDRASGRQIPTEQQISAIIDATPPRYRAFVWLAAATALRSAELAGLRRRDVDLLRKRLAVVQTYVEPMRGPALFGPPKSDAGTRMIPLPAVVVPVLLEHLNRYSGEGADGLVFLSDKGQPMSRHNRKWWRDACRTAGVAQTTHLHDLRHAGLTLAAQSGATLKELMAFAGHSSPRAALIYQHAAADRAVVLAEEMSRRLERPSSADRAG